MADWHVVIHLSSGDEGTVQPADGWIGYGEPNDQCSASSQKRGVHDQQSIERRSRCCFGVSSGV